MVTTSASRNSRSLSTRVAPHSRARASVMFWLQAMRFMSKASPTLATRAPSLPRPRMPSVLPFSPSAKPACQPPSCMARSSRGICFISDRISAQVCSAAG